MYRFCRGNVLSLRRCNRRNRRRLCGAVFPWKRYIYIGTRFLRLCAGGLLRLSEKLFLGTPHRSACVFILVFYRLGIQRNVNLKVFSARGVRCAVLLHLLIINCFYFFAGFFSAVGNSAQSCSRNEHEHRQNEHKLHNYSRGSSHKSKPGNAEHY